MNCYLPDMSGLCKVGEGGRNLIKPEDAAYDRLHGAARDRSIHLFEIVTAANPRRVNVQPAHHETAIGAWNIAFSPTHHDEPAPMPHGLNEGVESASGCDIDCPVHARSIGRLDHLWNPVLALPRVDDELSAVIA